MKRQLLALSLSLALLQGTAAAAELPALYINGEPASGVAYAENGTTYVSLRSVTEALDADARVSWEGDRAVVRSDGVELSAVPGRQWLTSNGKCFYLSGGVRLSEGRTLVPIRALAAAFGAEVTWDEGSNRILVDTVGEPPAAEYEADALYWLSRIISAESRGESLRGQIAVGNVVLNRVAHRDFPDTIYGVIFDDRWGGQFEPVRNGTVYEAPTEESVAAAKLCLEGVSAVGESLYFLDPAKAGNLWTVHNRPYFTTIGVHDFYL